VGDAADYIDTTDLLARALQSNVAFVPGRAGVPRRPRRLVDAAELLGVDEHAIREGVRRIGEVVREQVELFSTLTGHAPSARPEPAPAPVDEELADVLHLPEARLRERRAEP
jgi:2-aminoadipate transaminase